MDAFSKENITVAKAVGRRRSPNVHKADEYKGEKNLNRQVVFIIQQHLQSMTEFYDLFITQMKKILGM